jgi:hypothetical protein
MVCAVFSLHRLNDHSLFDARETLARNSAQPLFAHSQGQCCTSRYVVVRLLASLHVVVRLFSCAVSSYNAAI